MLNHKELLNYCNASYLGNEVAFERYLGLKGQTDAYYGDSLHKYVVELNDCYVIVYRGSVNKYDWINDLTCNTVDVQNVNIHEGFFCAVESQLFPRTSFDKPVVITGHSFGGALAIIEAFILSNCIGTEIKEVVTFGSPMPAAKSFQEKYEFNTLGSKTTRYVNGDDITPSLPPFRFYQVGKQQDIGKRRSWFNPAKYIHLFKDHSIAKYSESMEKFYE